MGYAYDEILCANICVKEENNKEDEKVIQVEEIKMLMI
jgi:hypothetical protein